MLNMTLSKHFWNSESLWEETHHLSAELATGLPLQNKSKQKAREREREHLSSADSEIRLAWWAPIKHRVTRAPPRSNPCFCHFQVLRTPIQTSQRLDFKHESFLALPREAKVFLSRLQSGGMIMTQVWVWFFFYPLQATEPSASWNSLLPHNTLHRAAAPMPRRRITFAPRTPVRCAHTHFSLSL